MEKLYRIKYYIIAMLLALGGYIWSMTSGVRLVGDDKETIEQRSAGGASHFYHK